MDAQSRPTSLLARTTAYTSFWANGTDAAAAASEHASSTPPTPGPSRTTVKGSEAAGGAVEKVAAGGIGSEQARDEGFAGQIVGRPILWRSRAGNGVHGLSGRTGRRERDRVRQNRIDLGNVPTPECESNSMYEDEGRVVPGTDAVAGYSVSSAHRCALVSAELRAGEPARGVMGGLVQPATPPVEPPVSSLSDPFTGTTTTAPAPIEVQARGVSPRTSAVRAA